MLLGRDAESGEGGEAPRVAFAGAAAPARSARRRLHLHPLSIVHPSSISSRPSTPRPRRQKPSAWQPMGISCVTTMFSTGPLAFPVSPHL